MLSHLVYVSTAREPMREPDLARLLELARERNKRYGITGMLLYKNGRFIQLLEGQEENVQKIFRSIARDERHYDVQLLWSRYAQYREFPDWTMGFQNIDELDPSILKAYTPFLDRDFRYEKFLENSTDVHAMLLAFKENPGTFG